MIKPVKMEYLLSGKIIVIGNILTGNGSGKKKN